MIKIFLAGSRKFSDDLQSIYKIFRDAGFEVLKGRDSPKEQLTEEEEKNAHIEMLRRIDKSDIVYIVTKDGYIGRTVAMEIGYAIAKEKKIISSDNITEAGLNHFISEILSPEKFVFQLKR